MTLSKIQRDALYLNFIKTFSDTDCWIAGGAITNVFLNCQPRDIDLYFPSTLARDNAVKTALDIGYEIINAGPLFITLKDKLNVEPYMIPLSGWDKSTNSRTRPIIFDAIHLGNTPHETIMKFDFTINQIAITKPTLAHPDGTLISSSTTQEDIIAKQMRITGNHPNRFLPNKARQIIKNLLKGFTIHRDELAKWFENVPEKFNTSQDQFNWLVNYIITYKR